MICFYGGGAKVTEHREKTQCISSSTFCTGSKDVVPTFVSEIFYDSQIPISNHLIPDGKLAFETFLSFVIRIEKLFMRCVTR